MSCADNGRISPDNGNILPDNSSSGNSPDNSSISPDNSGILPDNSSSGISPNDGSLQSVLTLAAPQLPMVAPQLTVGSVPAVVSVPILTLQV